MSKQYEEHELEGERSRLWQGYSRYGYTPQTALADVLDNSLSAGANLVRIDISEQVDGSNKVYITDNGKGMTRKRLQDALAFGSPEEIQNTKLSKFGFGMKTASLEVSPDGFSVVTRSAETGELSAASLYVEDQVGAGSLKARFWLEEHINPTWLSYLNDIVGEDKPGTVVIWEKADLKEADMYRENRGGKEQTRKRIENRISQYLGMVFHRWIEGNTKDSSQTKIIFQGDTVDAWDPLSPKYLDLDQIQDIKPFQVSNDDGDLVEVALKAWVIKKDLLKSVADSEARKNSRFQGIYLYRMDRIINIPQWFGVLQAKREPLNGLRFSLELDPSLDDTIHLDVKKSSAELPDQLLEQIAPHIEFYAKSEEARAHRNKAQGNKTMTPTLALESASKKYHELDKKAPTVRPERQSTTEVITTNESGEKLPLHLKELPPNLQGDNTVHLVEASETSGFLWEPRTARDLSLQVLINEDHDFYQKVMLPSSKEAYEGFIWLILAFSRAELATQYSNFKLQFNHMRRHMSETLESYAADLEMPNLAQIDE